MHIQWNKVTWYSKLLAVIIFAALFVLVFYVGMVYGRATIEPSFLGL